MTSHLHATPSLDHLESEVMARIMAHRRTHQRTGALPVGLFVTLTALAVGVVLGLHQPPLHRGAARSSEAVVLADDARLTPSILLVTGR